MHSGLTCVTDTKNCKKIVPTAHFKNEEKLWQMKDRLKTAYVFANLTTRNDKGQEMHWDKWRAGKYGLKKARKASQFSKR